MTRWRELEKDEHWKPGWIYKYGHKAYGDARYVCVEYTPPTRQKLAHYRVILWAERREMVGNQALADPPWVKRPLHGKEEKLVFAKALMGGGE
jgi:hypothetical protein